MPESIKDVFGTVNLIVPVRSAILEWLLKLTSITEIYGQKIIKSDVQILKVFHTILTLSPLNFA